MARVLYACFFMSGAAGLLYEIYWAQRFSLVLGVDIYSHAAVLTAFMGGLAIGGHLLGRRADRLKQPLAIYALLELGIGVCGLLIPAVLSAADVPMRWAYEWSEGQTGAMTLIRFLTALLVLVIPTALMGGTLPVMTRVLREQDERLGVVVGRLYAMNTLGAVVGILAGGFVLSELLGLWGTNLTAVALNAAAAVLAYQLSRDPNLQAELAAPRTRDDGLGGAALPGAVPEPGDRFLVSTPAAAAVPVAAERPAPTWSAPALSNPPKETAVVIGLAAGLTGAAAMITQVGWVRTITLLIGSSSYAFTLVVAVFLVGLSLGAWLAAKAIRWWPDATVPWGLACVLTAAFSWITMWLLGYAPESVRSTLIKLTNQDVAVPRIYAILALQTFLVLGAPTIILGTTFPLACEAYAQRFARGAGRITGSLYAVNTVGAMLGSALGGLVLIALFGAQHSLNLAAVLYLVTGLLVYAVADRRQRRRFPGAVGPVVFAVVLGLAGSTAWSRGMMLSAPFNLSFGEAIAEDQVVYFREAPEATVAVAEFKPEGGPANYALLISGKPDASTSGDLGTQVLLGQVPMLLHGSAKDVAVIGLGSGATLHCVLTHPVERVDMVELSRAVVEAVRPPDGSAGPFDSVNGRSLDDPRVNLIVGDGRNHLTLTSRKYDVIISEPSNPWFAGVASLFTKEFFESCKARLNDDGVLCQWLQAYDMYPREFFRVLRTMGDVFENVTVWVATAPGADYIIIATPKPRPSLESVARLMEIPAIRDNLATIKITRPQEFWSLYMMDLADLDSFPGVGRLADLHPNTDNRNKLAFTCVRSLWAGVKVSFSDLWTYSGHPLAWTGPLDLNNSEHLSLLQGVADMQDGYYLYSLYDASSAATYGSATMSLNAKWYEYEDFVSEYNNCRAQGHQHGDPPQELKKKHAAEARRLLDRVPESTDRMEQFLLGRSARAHAVAARYADPEDKNALALLAEALWRMQKTDLARMTMVAALQAGVEVKPELRAALEEPEAAPAEGGTR